MPQTPREELEARITALLLGQLPDAEATALRQLIAADRELQRLHDRLIQTIALVRETVVSPAHEGLATAEEPKLPTERRERLLAAFKVDHSKELTRREQRRAQRRDLALLAAMIAGLIALAGVVAPNFIKARSSAQMGDRSRIDLYAGRFGFDSDAELATSTAGPEQARVAKEANALRFAQASDPAFAKKESSALDYAFTPPADKPLSTDQEIASAYPGAPLAVPPALGRPVLPETLRKAAVVSVPQQPTLPNDMIAAGVQLTENLGRAHLQIALPTQKEESDFVVNESQASRSGDLSSDNRSSGRALGIADSVMAASGELHTTNRVNGFENVDSRGGNIAAVGDAFVIPPPEPPLTIPAAVELKDGRENEKQVAARQLADGLFSQTDSGAKGDAKAMAYRGLESIQPGGAGGDTAGFKRPEIALPGVILGDVPERIQVATGPVADREPMPNDPATGLPVKQPAEPAPENSEELTALSRNLDALRLNQEKLSERLVQERVNAAIPRSGSVQIIDAAEATPPQSQSLWERARGIVSGDVERSARIAVQKNATDIVGIGGVQTYSAFDPYWVQTDIERIQSKVVLGKVVEQLNLNEGWAEANGRKNKLTEEETVQLLKRKIDVRSDSKTGLIDIRVKSDSPEEAARIANTIAQVYRDSRLEQYKELSSGGVQALEEELLNQRKEFARVEHELERRKKELDPKPVDEPAPKLAVAAPVPQPEVNTAENFFSTFSLNVSDVSFKLAAAALEKGQMPDPATVRSEEFINAFDYRDPEPAGSAPIAFAWERARYPFAHDRDLLRFSVKTAASGRQPGRPLNLVLLLDNSGSMERADRIRIRHECLRVLASQLQPQDRVSVVAFARTARLWVDGLPGSQAGELPQRVGGLAPEGGTNLEDAMNLAYVTALRHFLANGVNRVVLLTDGAANLGDVKPESLKEKVETHRRQGVALDCFGIGWEGLNDELLEALSRNGDGRYGFVNTPEAATSEFVSQLAGALKVAASDVKVQVEWNPRRVTAYRQIGYAKHQLKKEQFRDNTVDAAEIGAAEAGNALYTVQVNPRGEGPLGVVRVRFKVPGTSDYREHEWPLLYEGAAKPLDQSSPALRLAASASAFSEWLVSSPFAAEVTPDKLLGYLTGVPGNYSADPRPKKLEWMIRQAKSLAGK